MANYFSAINAFDKTPAANTQHKLGWKMHWGKLVSKQPAKRRCAAPATSSASVASPLHKLSKTEAAAHSLTAADKVNKESLDLRKKIIEGTIHLKEHGWASLDGIISLEECRAYEDGFWDWLACLGTGIKREDPTTWKGAAWPPSFRGIINSLEVAHQAFVWRIRKHPRILQVFADIWGSAALLSSFDSINALPAGEQPHSEAWLHVDQAPCRPGVCCIQGLVNMVDVSATTTGTLLVKDFTHLAHEEFFDKISKMPRAEQRKIGDHYKFTEAELPHWEKFKSVGISGKAGSLFLWDSRAVHANVFPDILTEPRHVVYTCFQPAALASPQDLEVKQRAYREYLLTTHWPAMNIRCYDRDQAVEYYGVAGEEGRPAYKINRTRCEVEDRQLLQLAGMVPYAEHETNNRPPLINLSIDELRSMFA